METREHVIALTAIVNQFDRRKYSGSIETLVSLLSAIPGLDFRILVVDNADEGDWEHEFTDRVIHLGGDNSCWEFSAFDRGLGYARSHPFREDLYLFVTDAYMAYGNEFLKLIGRDALAAAVGWGACIGWVDAYPEAVEFYGREYREWVRSSFVFVPSDFVKEIEPLAYPIALEEVFGGTPDEIFGPETPLSERLQQYLVEWLLDRGDDSISLEEQWHSKFELNLESYPRFVEKASAILREQALSLRLREAEIPVFDFRALPLLKSPGASDLAFEPRPDEAWEWLGWRTQPAAPKGRYCLDHFACPAVLTRGEEAWVEAQGWAIAEEGAREHVCLDVGGHGFGEQACILAREDLAGAVEDPRCGFHLRESLSNLPVGLHEVRLKRVQSGESVSIGSVRVEPSFSFTPIRVFVPEFCSASIASPVEIYGVLVSDAELDSVHLRVGDEDLTDAVSLLGEGRTTTGELRYQVRVAGECLVPTHRTQLELQLEFYLQGGSQKSWSQTVAVRAGVSPHFSIARWDLGRWDAAAGTVRIRVEGQVAIDSDAAQLVLRHEAREVWVERLALAPDFSSRLAPFRVERRVSGIGVGKTRLALCVRKGGEETLLEERDFFVAFEEPELYVDGVEVERCQDQPGASYLIRSSGWIRHHHLVDSLALHVDGDVITGLGWNELRPEVPGQDGSPLMRHQGFNFAVEAFGLEPGPHEVELVATGVGVPEARCRKRVEFPDIPSAGFRIVSEDLESLERPRPPVHFGEYVFRGRIESDCADVVARLFLDGQLADEFSFPERDEDSFVLRARPKLSGPHSVRVVFSVSGSDRFDTGEVDEVECREILTPPASVGTWEQFLDLFDLKGRVEGRLSARASLETLLSDRETPSRHWLEILDQLDSRLGGDPGQARSAVRPIPDLAIERPLRVLFCSWGAPYSRHGGGVHLMHLLRGLGARHEITLVHTYGDDLELAEEARPYVSRMLSVPRHHAALDYRERGLLPPRYYQEYVPELEKVIDRELSTGVYDLVNFEWSIMRTVPLRAIPSVLAVHELEYTAFLSSLLERNRERALKIEEVGELLRLFWFNVVDLPKAFDALITITPEDARDISAFAPESRIFVNEAASDAKAFGERFEEVSASLERGEPTFLFVANYRHPPNLRSAFFLIEKVMPLIRRQIPGARLELVGPHAPDSLQSQAQEGDLFLGFVEDLAAVYARAAAAMLPIFSGTGMRIKAVEALGHGCPLIGTELGMRGVGSPEREAFVLAESADQFAEVAVALVKNPKRLSRMGVAAADHVRQRLSADRLVQNRERIWQDVISSVRSE